MPSSSSLAPTLLKPALNLAEARRLLSKYCYNDTHKPHYSYGTAGFRYLSTELCPIMLRVGLVAALLALDYHECDVGVMITASHNTAEYNGVKLAGADGGMIDAASEDLAVYIVNERNIERLMQFLQDKLATSSSSATSATVHIGRDTREHSVSLACLVIKAAVAMGCLVVDHCVVTTPMLHHAVKHANAVAGTHQLPLAIPIRLNTAGYYELLVHSYVALLATNEVSFPLQDPVLTVDCACGVGYPHLKALTERLEQTGLCHRKIVATNPPAAGPLNEACGSEYVQKEQTACNWYKGEGDDDIFQTYCASLDGDADRIVFFSSVNNTFTLLDGDKMACLIGNFLQDQLTAVLAACAATTTALPSVKLGVVQTAYANGASTDYLQSHGVATCVARTGVKFVHAAAHHNFDIGVYFEANGHGTVLFGDRYHDFLHAAGKAVPGGSKQALAALQRLRVLPALINQAVGDALSDLLLVDAVLQLQGWSMAHWAQALYQDLPSRQLKVKVADRTVIETNGNETECLAPSAVQPELRAAVLQCERGRAFVRPSGTEDVVRIYAEAATAQQADALAAKAAEIVHRLCGGVGDAPSHSRM